MSGSSEAPPRLCSARFKNLMGAYDGQFRFVDWEFHRERSRCVQNGSSLDAVLRVILEQCAYESLFGRR